MTASHRRTTRWALSAAVTTALLAAGAAVTPAAAAPAEEEGSPAPVALRAPGETALVVGHRGNSSIAPENTLPAVDGAVRAGADLVEIDIDYTADDRIVVIHDDTVDRTTDGTGAVRSLTSDEISGLEAGSWFSPAYAGTPMPFLEDVLAVLQETGVHLLLEYKAPWDEEHVALTRDLIEEYGVADQIIAQSFDFTTLASLQAAYPELPRMVLGDHLDDGVAVAERFDAIGVNPPGARVLDDPAFVARMHDAGLATFVWTMNDPAQWAALTEIGVDGIITDRPDRLVGWNARGDETPEPPTEPEAPAWAASTAYDAGALVSHDDRVFRALWWTRGEEPGTSTSGAWAERGAPVSCQGEPVEGWTASGVYDAGDRVVSDGELFAAGWWTRDQRPGGATGPWQSQGAC